MKPCYLSFCILFIFIGRSYAQTTTTTTTSPAQLPVTTTVPVTATVTPPSPPPPGTPNITRPSQPLNEPEIDNYVTACFGVYDQTNSIQTQLNAIEQQAMGTKKLSQVDENSIESQLTTMKTQLISAEGTGQSLLLATSQINDDVVKDLKDKPLKIPGAYVRIKNSTKAVKVSLQNIHTMETVTIVNIEHKLNIPVKADTAKTANVTVVNTGKTTKTSINITGISFTTFNSFNTELATITSIKSSTRKFNLGGTSVINVVHYGDTDALLAAILANCKDIVSEKNVGGSEKGKIILAFQP